MECSIQDCENPAVARGWCSSHYARWYRGGGLGQTCAVEGCPKPVNARGWCSSHYSHWRKHGDPTIYLRRVSPPKYPPGQSPATCTVADCSKPARTAGLCSGHYWRNREYGSPNGSGLKVCPKCRIRNFSVSSGKGICSHCWQVEQKRLGVRRFWDRPTLVRAGREWIELTGRAPRSTDWTHISDRGVFPATQQVIKHFGTWNAFVRELPADPRPKIKRQPDYTPDNCLVSGFQYVDRHGDIPSLTTWGATGMRPGRWVIERCFGSWSNFTSALRAIEAS